MRKLAICLLLGACAAGPDVDQADNVYPPACSQAATDAIAGKVPERGASPDLLASFNKAKRGEVTEGITLFINSVPVMVLYNERLAGWRKADVLRHERCHVIAGPYWHK